MRRLGINIDHIATLRNARSEGHPNIIQSAKAIMTYGAHSITVHLREDRRHIKDKDLLLLVKSKIPINLEMASNKKMLDIALRRKPKFVDTPLYEEFPEVRQFPLTADAGTVMTDATITDTPDKEVEEIEI